MGLRAGSGGGFREVTGGSLWLVLELELEFVRESRLSGEGGRERDGGGGGLLEMRHNMYAGNVVLCAMRLTLFGYAGSNLGKTDLQR